MRKFALAVALLAGVPALAQAPAPVVIGRVLQIGAVPGSDSIAVRIRLERALRGSSPEVFDLVLPSRIAAPGLGERIGVAIIASANGALRLWDESSLVRSPTPAQLRILLVHARN